MSEILSQIIATQKDQLPSQKNRWSNSDLRSFPGYEKKVHSLAKALQKNSEPVSIIAEFKRASPSRGEISSQADVRIITDQYIQNGASALSILTNEPYFKGSVADIVAVAEECPIPILRKEFIIDPWQITQSKAIGADAILLIMAALEPTLLHELVHAANEEGLEVLLECDRPEHIERLEQVKEMVRVVGVNNRDLRNFSIDQTSGLSLLQTISNSFIRVSESGHQTPDDLQRVYEAGIDAVLIGTAFMNSENPGQELRNLRNEMKFQSDGSQGDSYV